MDLHQKSFIALANCWQFELNALGLCAECVLTFVNILVSVGVVLNRLFLELN